MRKGGSQGKERFLDFERLREDEDLPLEQRVENAKAWFDEHAAMFNEILQGQDINASNEVLEEISNIMEVYAPHGGTGWVIEHGLLEIVFERCSTGVDRPICLRVIKMLAQANYTDAIELLRRGILDLCMSFITAEVPDSMSASEAGAILHRLIIGDIVIASLIYSSGLLHHLAAGLQTASKDTVPAVATVLLAMLAIRYETETFPTKEQVMTEVGKYVESGREINEEFLHQFYEQGPITPNADMLRYVTKGMVEHIGYMNETRCIDQMIICSRRLLKCLLYIFKQDRQVGRYILRNTSVVLIFDALVRIPDLRRQLMHLISVIFDGVDEDPEETCVEQSLKAILVVLADFTKGDVNESVAVSDDGASAEYTLIHTLTGLFNLVRTPGTVPEEPYKDEDFCRLMEMWPQLNANVWQNGVPKVKSSMVLVSLGLGHEVAMDFLVPCFSSPDGIETIFEARSRQTTELIFDLMIKVFSRKYDKRSPWDATQADIQSRLVDQFIEYQGLESLEDYMNSLEEQPMNDFVKKVLRMAEYLYDVIYRFDNSECEESEVEGQCEESEVEGQCEEEESL